jgi:anti-sigma factor RsiW
MSTPDMPSLRLLLLHRLPEAEAHQLEERLMLEEQLAELLREAEHDLLDDYASGRLAPEDRAAVEQYLLATAADRERLKLARALARLRSRPEGARSRSDRPSVIPTSAATARIAPATRPRSAPRWPVRLGVAIAACAVLSLGVLVFRMKVTRRLPEPMTATVVLLADAQRGSTEGSINISPTVARVRLQLEIPAKEAASTYTLEIADGGGHLAYEAHDLPPRLAGPYPFVEALVPASALEGPRCRIRLTDFTRASSAASGRAFTWDIQVQRH